MNCPVCRHNTGGIQMIPLNAPKGSRRYAFDCPCGNTWTATEHLVYAPRARGWRDSVRYALLRLSRWVRPAPRLEAQA
jgi:hypothetical protein